MADVPDRRGRIAALWLARDDAILERPTTESPGGDTALPLGDRDSGRKGRTPAEFPCAEGADSWQPDGVDARQVEPQDRCAFTSASAPKARLVPASPRLDRVQRQPSGSMYRILTMSGLRGVLAGVS